MESKQSICVRLFSYLPRQRRACLRALRRGGPWFPFAPFAEWAPLQCPRLRSAECDRRDRSDLTKDASKIKRERRKKYTQRVQFLLVVFGFSLDTDFGAAKIREHSSVLAANDSRTQNHHAPRKFLHPHKWTQNTQFTIGSTESLRISSEVMMMLPSATMVSCWRGALPVAITKCSASITPCFLSLPRQKKKKDSERKVVLKKKIRIRGDEQLLVAEKRPDALIERNAKHLDLLIHLLFFG